MWLPLMSLLTLVAMGPQADSDSSGLKPPLPAAVATRQNLFAIPFRIERPDLPAHEPVEVQLYVSGDRGAHWQLYSKVEPTRQQFMFRAGADGEYWFLVRTVDRSGQLRPEGFGSPGLRVVVDTTPPRLQLSASRGQDGQITARWRIEEPNPRPETLRIQYRTADDAPWQPVAIDQKSLTSSGSIQAGELAWWPQASGETQIRADISDAAGNPSVSHARVKLEGVAGAEAPPAVADPTSPWRSGTDGVAASNWPADRATTPLPGENRLGGAASDSRYADDPGASQSGGDGSGDERYRDRRYPAQHEFAPGVSGQLDPRGPPPASEGGPPPTSSPSGSVAASVNPAIQNRYLPPDQQTAIPGAVGLPPGERPRMVNSRRFELEYEIESASVTAGARVELWGTRDGGRTWRSYATDGDNHGTLPVSVDEEGIYGFRMALTSAAGTEETPQSGDLPEVWIGVDLTRPTARLTVAQPGSGTEAGKLILCWEAADNMLLAGRPVTLSFSETLGGPWTTIAAGLENTGRYAWPTDNRLPERVFLQLEISDEAGNQGVFETSDAVTLDRSHPAARIRDVRPLDTKAQRHIGI